MKILSGCLIAIIVCLILYLLTAFIGMCLWNAVLIELFPMIPKIDFWQMYGLIWLIHIIFPSSSSTKWSE